MKKIRGFAAFIAESKIINNIDWLKAEEFFAGHPNTPDCIPSNAREWSKLSRQIQRLTDLSVSVAQGDIEYAEWMDSPEQIMNHIVGKDGYKKSLAEILNDCKGNRKLIRELDSVGISVPHMNFVLEDIAESFGSLKSSAESRKSMARILAAKKAGATMLDEKDLARELGRGWRITKTTVRDLLGVAEDDDIVDVWPDFTFATKVDHRAYTCHKKTKNRSEFQYFDVIVFHGFWICTLFGTDRITDDIGLTPNDKFKSEIDSIREEEDE